jgi:glycosyltransferase involved in cell wall biosynthesis
VNKNSFVFVVCGERHAARVNVALRYLKHFSRSDIIVVKSRARQAIECDQVLDCAVPAALDNHQASIFLKTSLHRTLAHVPGRHCYLDSDVIALGPDVDTLFDQARGPITYAQDHGDLGRFSRFAVNCGCSKGGCGHLIDAIRDKFQVSVTDRSWNHWNGGVFLFDAGSAEFLDTWHRSTLSIFADPYWKTRDQGTLVATVWRYGLQHQATLPRIYNYLVDCCRDIPLEQRKALKPRKLPVDRSYTLQDEVREKPRPKFVHFINGGVGRRGWANWDEAERLLEQDQARAAPAISPADAQRPALSPDNRIVHGMWIGTRLSKMELLTIKSFIRQGHEFHLWAYDDLGDQLPQGVVLEDATAIIPRDAIMRKAEVDPESGVGKGSLSPFSDLFRYKLLYEKGGYWVDMDVTCLKPLDFDTPYVFRPHRVGVVGNIMKCPPHSELMRTLYEQIAGEINPHSPWLMTNRTLSQRVRDLGLERYIRTGIWNEESWAAIRPLALEQAPMPSHWVAIHWLNEFWRSLQQSGGVYQGRRLYDVAPDKEAPHPGSALARLYAEHGLVTTPPAPASIAVPMPPAPLNRPAERQPSTPQFFLPSHVNVLVASLARGGAERIVLEDVYGLRRRKSSGKLFVLHDARPSYPLDDLGNVRAYPLHALEPMARLRAVASEVLASPEQTLFTHLIMVEHLRHLWAWGIKTVPVIHNTRESWQDPADAYNSREVPFVVAVSEQVARQLREDGCTRRIVVIRHELQRWFSVEDQQVSRRLIRERHGIPDRTLLIGMVGEFKSQKAYTRAVRVLARLREHQPVKLLILGGWDHDWGHGRQTYTATHRLAVELDVVADLLTPGSVGDSERYYAAFDVFLNTSVHDGLSISLLEAIQAGCPIVSADVGGNREVVPERAVLVQDPADIDAYVAGIRQVLRDPTRVLAPKAPDHDLVPRLWPWLGRFAREELLPPLAARDGTLFLTDNLNIGGAQRSLINLLCQLPEQSRPLLAVLDTAYCQGYIDQLQTAAVPTVSLREARDYLAKLERTLSLIERYRPRSVCFWNVDPRIKLLLAKIFPPQALRLVDVSPGPFLFEEMEQARVFQQRIAFPAAEYWQRLDHFVAKYSGGLPPDASASERKLVVIPNGVPIPAPVDPLFPGPELPLPAGADPEKVIGATCRITPGKRIDFLIDMLAEVNRYLQGVNLVIVGGIDPRHADYWPLLQERLRAKGVHNLHFAGPQHDVTPYLRRFQLLVMLADTPGCPNSSLEAMALGVPVVANAAGGTGEQVLHGKNGFLVGGDDAAEMAQRVLKLLSDRGLRRRFGEAARATATRHFSMQTMVRRYRRLLEAEPSGQFDLEEHFPALFPPA